MSIYTLRNLLVILFTSFYLSSFSATLTVCSSGCDHTTIQAAINAASAFDVIQINEATHTELSITVNKSDLTIQGQGQTTTIVQAAGTQASASDRIFVVNTSITVNFQDLTLRHGNATGRGGAILLNSSSAVTFTRVTLTNNDSSEDGGAIASASSTSGIVLILEECIVSNNNAGVNTFSDGGGIYSSGGNTTLTKCSIFNNQCGDDGGGVYISEFGSVNTFTNCVISGNTSGTAADGMELIDGGGVALFDGICTMTNCTVANNTASGATGAGGGVAIPSAVLHITNNIFADNTASFGADIAAAGSTIGINNNNLCEACAGPGCPTFLSTADPSLEPLNDCNNSEILFGHEIDPGTAGENIGTSTGAPATDLCGNPRSNPPDLGATEVGTNLPVDLLDFDAILQGEEVLLTWKTAMEYNNEGFEIERSPDGKNWEYLDFIAGRGISYEILSYSTIDPQPLTGMNHYRLKQFDLDGNFEYSDIVSVSTLVNRPEGSVKVYPNPVQNGTLYVFSSEAGQKASSVFIYDQLGKLVFHANLLDEATTLDLSDLQGGFYVWCVEAETFKKQGKLVVE